MTNAQFVTFPAAGGGPMLEGMLHLPESPAPSGYAVVCHPHPQMGGRMDSPIVIAVCRALATQGWTALRFNFRGAGRSQGAFDEGRGEMDDVAGALDFLQARGDVLPEQVAVMGYSFGAWVGLRHAARDRRVGWLVGIALVQEHYAEPFLDDEVRPKLFIVGERDAWAPAEALRAYVVRLKPPKALHVLPGTDHFFGGREGDVARLVAGFVSDS